MTVNASVAVISSCSNKKKMPPISGLTTDLLPEGSLPAISNKWLGLLRAAKEQSGALTAANSVYCGRNFMLAARSATTANHYIVSAGIGLLHGKDLIPSYNLTVTGKTEANIGLKIEGFDVQQWWDVLAHSPFSTVTIEEICREHEIVILALPTAYLAMITNTLLMLESETRSKLRIISADRKFVDEELREFHLPFDERIDGPDSILAGTKTDFSGRAAVLFRENILLNSEGISLNEHQQLSKLFINDWRPPKKFKRERKTDFELEALIRRDWEVTQGRSRQMLRHIRDALGVACEQSRFQNLFKTVSAEKEHNPHA